MYCIVGRDGSGVIVSVGSGVTAYKVGDEVYYAGDITRNGSYSQYTLVDSRIIGHKPKSLTHVEAAALPLTTLTFHEGLYENNLFHLRGDSVKGQHILIVAGAGGVGSIGIQLAKHYGLIVTATASRPETVSYCKSLGADYIIDHSKPLKDQVEKLNLGSSTPYSYIFNTHDDSVLNEIVSVAAPLAHITMILPLTKHIDTAINIFYKRITIHFELMYTRSMYHVDEQKQGDILNWLTKLVESGVIKTTLNKTYECKDMIAAQKFLETGKSIGKTVVKID